ncbi:MAG: hypothetical protein ABI181_05400 [Mycobacteriaceae bacterium]
MPGRTEMLGLGGEVAAKRAGTPVLIVFEPGAVAQVVAAGSVLEDHDRTWAWR